jgi:hypothetical protein
MDSNEKLQERRKHLRKKVRVLVRFKDQFLFESFTCDVSLNGVFVLVDSENVLERLSLDLELEFYLEYKLDSMMKAIGVVRRIQGEEVPEDKRGFALEITEIAGEHRKLLAGIIDKIREE